MPQALTVLGGLVAFAALIAVAVMLARSYLNLAAQRVITCPDNQEPAAVRIDVGQATRDALQGGGHYRLSACSRWPEKAGCGQECVAQIERAPEDCLVRHLATRWFEGKSCAYCRKPFGEIHWHDHPPALRSADGVTRTWKEVRAEELPAALAASRPVCFNCHVAESFRREHPDLVIDRPPRPRAHV